MVLLPVASLKPGMIVAKNVYDNNVKSFGLSLIMRGTVLGEPIIKRLQSHGIMSVYIERTGTEDISPEEILTNDMKNAAISSIRSTFETIMKADQQTSTRIVGSMTKLSESLVENAINNPDIMINLNSLKSYDDYTYTHSLCVSLLSIATGMSMGFDKHMLKNLSTAALLHDIGKVMVPISIINKPSKLTNEEFLEVRKHPEYGIKIVEKRKAMLHESVMFGIRAHHERFDGNGYPGSLGSEKIHPFGKIIAVADVYDAITSNRPYRKPAQPFEAVEYIMGCGNSHFDIQTVNHFLKKIVAFPEGSVVKLSDGSRGIVVSNNPENVMRPRLRLLRPDGAMKDVNMLNDPSCLSLTILGMDDIA